MDTEKAPNLSSSLTASPHKTGPNHSDGSSSDENYAGISKAEKLRLMRKIDLNLLPIITLLYLMSFLDRTNIGNAKIAGLATDLKLVGNQYNICLSILFVSYVSFEIPSNVVLKRLRPSIWLPSICLGWGIVTTLTGIVQNFGGLVTVRILLGFLEAGLFPGVVFLLTVWYPRHELTFRFSLFFSAATLAGAFGGLLARGLIRLDGHAGLAGWRWIFIVEGIITVAVALAAYFLVPNEPSTARFLNEHERRQWVDFLAKDSSNEPKNFSWPEIRSAFKEPKVYLAAVICLGIALPTFSFALFVPSIMTGLGYKNAQAQLMTVPPYAVAFLLTLATGYISDRTKRRGIPLIVATVVAMIGYIIELSVSPKRLSVKYFGVFLIAAGVYPASAINIPWLSNNIHGHSKRAVGSAVQVAVGQLGGIVGAYIYTTQGAPKYILGHAIALGFLGAALITTLAQMVYLTAENRRLRSGESPLKVPNTL